jgi:hypothetical protein
VSIVLEESRVELLYPIRIGKVRPGDLEPVHGLSRLSPLPLGRCEALLQISNLLFQHVQRAALFPKDILFLGQTLLNPADLVRNAAFFNQMENRLQPGHFTRKSNEPVPKRIRLSPFRRCAHASG